MPWLIILYNGTEIENPEEIINCQKEYFETLYTQLDNIHKNNDTNINQSFLIESLPMITQEEQEYIYGYTHNPKGNCTCG